jgi:hypothetical protein
MVTPSGTYPEGHPVGLVAPMVFRRVGSPKSN